MAREESVDEGVQGQGDPPGLSQETPSADVVSTSEVTTKKVVLRGSPVYTSYDVGGIIITREGTEVPADQVQGILDSARRMSGIELEVVPE